MALGFAALFFPPVRGSNALLAWCAVALVVTCLGYSALGVLHQAWGARLGGGDAAQARIAGWREGLSLAGVLAASVLPALADIPVMVAVCIAGLALAIVALGGAPFRAAPPRRRACSSRGIRASRPSRAPGRCRGGCRPSGG